MEKKVLNRLGYGFSALVIGLSAVSFYPVSRAFATGGESSETSETTEGSEGAGQTGGQETGGAENPAGGAETGSGSEGAGGAEDTSDPANTSDPEDAENGENTGDGENEEDGDDEDEPVYVSPFEKIVKTGDSLEVEGLSIMVSVRGEDGDIENIACLDDNDIASCGEIPATAEGVTIKRTSDGKISVKFDKSGEYWLNTLVDIEEFYAQSINVRVVDVETEAAGTVTDILGEIQEISDLGIAALIACDEGEGDEAACAALEALEERWFAAELKAYNAFGDDLQAIARAVYTGKALSTEVKVEGLTEVDEDVKAALMDQMDITFADNVSFYDIDVVIYADGEEIGTLKELTSDQVIAISGFSGPAAGFKRVFQVVRYHTYIDENGEEQVEITVIDDVDFDEVTGTITFASDKFSTFAVGYKDVLAASVDTGAFTTEGASATSSAAISVIAAATIISLIGAVKFAKR